MPSMFVPEEREAALDAANTALAVEVPEGFTEGVANALNAILPTEATATDVMECISSLLALVFANGFRTLMDSNAQAQATEDLQAVVAAQGTRIEALESKLAEFVNID